MIAPQWLLDKDPAKKRVLEGLFRDQDIKRLNLEGYKVYHFPNGPTELPKGRPVNGTDIDQFQYVMVDADIKDGIYATKEDFIAAIGEKAPLPSKVVDSGNGVHAYWKVSGLDAISYLRLTRRMMRLLATDPAVGQILQLMTLPGTLNTKDPSNFKQTEVLFESQTEYTAEELNNLLPVISQADEEHCQQHLDKTYNTERFAQVSDKIPPKFGQLLRENHEAKELWAGATDDRSKNDYRLGHLMFSNDFSREEAISVLVNSAKALNRAPVHRVSYAENIVDKIWTFELEPKNKEMLSQSVAEILKKGASAIKGTPFRCNKLVDNTVHGFRLGQVLGLVGGSGIGKTAFALNMFKWFAENNPDYHSLFVPLEQPANEIADRWQTLCGDNTSLHEKVHILSNYDDDGNFRHLSFDEIREYVEHFQKTLNVKIGCIVIDHIGALKKKDKDGENQDLMSICHAMKAFAIQTNTLLVMQSQTSREKAGIGDLELNKDAAYGTMYFEAYCDYLITLWQPLKRCHAEPGCPTVTAFKFCKIRHKKAKLDRIQEDVPYFLYFDSDKEHFRSMTQDEMTSFSFFQTKAVGLRKRDRKTDIVQYQQVPTDEGANVPKADDNRYASRH